MSTSVARLLAAAGAALVALCIVFGSPASGASRHLDGGDPTPPPPTTTTSATTDGGNPWHG
jgi:hypothetical protein